METKETNRQRPLLRGLCVLADAGHRGGRDRWCLQVRDDRDAAVASFNAACLALHDQNIALDKAMADLEDAINAGGHLCDEAVLQDAHNSLADAKDAKQDEPNMPRRTADIIDATERIFPTVDYDAVLKEMSRCQTALETCIAPGGARLCRLRFRFLKPHSEQNKDRPSSQPMAGGLCRYPSSTPMENPPLSSSMRAFTNSCASGDWYRFPL